MDITLTREFLCDLLQKALNIVSEWCDNNGLSINPGKKKMIQLTWRNRVEGIKLPTIKGISKSLVDLVKYLGIILDCKLNCQQQISKHLHLNSKYNVQLWPPYVFYQRI